MICSHRFTVPYKLTHTSAFHYTPSTAPFSGDVNLGLYGSFISVTQVIEMWPLATEIATHLGNSIARESVQIFT